MVYDQGSGSYAWMYAPTNAMEYSNALAIARREPYITIPTSDVVRVVEAVYGMTAVELVREISKAPARTR